MTGPQVVLGPAEAEAPGNLTAHLAELAERLLWAPTSRFPRKVAASFTDPHRRVLLAGEAATSSRRSGRAA